MSPTFHKGFLHEVKHFLFKKKRRDDACSWNVEVKKRRWKIPKKKIFFPDTLIKTKKKSTYFFLFHFWAIFKWMNFFVGVSIDTYFILQNKPAETRSTHRFYAEPVCLAGAQCCGKHRAEPCSPALDVTAGVGSVGKEFFWGGFSNHFSPVATRFVNNKCLLWDYPWPAHNQVCAGSRPQELVVQISEVNSVANHIVFWWFLWKIIQSMFSPKHMVIIRQMGSVFAAH